MPDLAARYAHVPAKTVRFWAWLDSSVSYTLAIPPLSLIFLRALYRINGWLGGDATMPALDPLAHFFVCLSGALISVWVIARLLHPVGILAVVDGWGRVAVSALLVWFVAFGDAPRVLLLFIVTEMAGAIGQLRAAYRT